MEDPQTEGKFLGGWRSKLTGIVYCNACTQTGKNGCKKEERVQTEFTVDKCTNVERDVAVQANFFPDIRDRVVRCSTKEPELSLKDLSNEKILESVVKIQRFYRKRNLTLSLTISLTLCLTVIQILGFPASNVSSKNPLLAGVSQLRVVNYGEQNLQEHLFKRPFDVARRAHRVRQTASRPANVSPRTKNTERQIHPEPGEISYRSRDFVILNRTSPSTRADFELLYNLLDRWRVQETERANEQLFEASRIALCSLILAKEVELLRAIDAIKTTVKLRRKEQSYRKFLDELSKPVLWKSKRGQTILVDTPRVLHARSFKDTYEELVKDGGDVKERLEMLNKLRKDVETHTCRASDEVIRLLDQEIDLLVRNVDQSKLHWLRSRLKMAFLSLAKEALANDCKDSSLANWLRRKTICKSCGRLLPLEKFSYEKQHRSSSCNYCLYVKVRKGPRVVYEPYQRLLRDVRRHEAEMHCYSSLAFVIDAKTVYHLVNDIWHGKSVISEKDCLEELRLVRFRNDEEWSPWNCLLLTAREASLHRKVKDLEKFYGTMILQKFYTKNLQAKVRFQSVGEFKSVCQKRQHN